MDAVEINAGAWYLRALRADDRITDVPALADLGVDDPESFVAAAAQGWRQETRFVWGVCLPATGETVALIGLTPAAGAGHLWGRARTGFREALDAAIGPVSRFAEGALQLPTPERMVDEIPEV